MSRLVNGLDVDDWEEIKGRSRKDPASTRFKLKAKTRWSGRARSRTEISTSYGKTFTIEGDEPPSLLGEGSAPKAVEYVLHALGACLAAGLVYNASARGINVESVEVDLEGNIDLQGFLGTSDKVRPGYQGISLRCKIMADAPRDELESLWDHVQRTSPVLDIVKNGVPVSLNLERIG